MSGKRTQAERKLDWDTGRDLERRDAEIERLRAKLRKVASWLDKLAHAAEKAAKDTRFSSLAEAQEADAKNYRAVISDIRTVLPTDTGSVT